jgi:hypothetical protein
MLNLTFDVTVCGFLLDVCLGIAFLVILHFIFLVPQSKVSRFLTCRLLLCKKINCSSPIVTLAFLSAKRLDSYRLTSLASVWCLRNFPESPILVERVPFPSLCLRLYHVRGWIRVPQRQTDQQMGSNPDGVPV